MNLALRTLGATLGWHGELELQFAPRGARTALVTWRHSGPLLVQRPFYPEADGVCHTYLLHPPAGIVGGDDLHISADLASGARVLLTTPSATRFYRSAGPAARLVQHLCIADGASLEWLPQETLLFDGARAQIETRVQLTSEARFIGWDLVCLGRPACGEAFDYGSLDLQFTLHRDGRPLLLERLRPPPGTALAAGGPGLRGHAVSATLIATGAAPATLALARQLMTDDTATLAAATLLDDVLVCRALASHIEPARALWARLWTALRPALLGRPAQAPRIWAT